MSSFADRLLDRGAGLAPAHAAAPAPRRPPAVAPLEIDLEGDTIEAPAAPTSGAEVSAGAGEPVTGPAAPVPAPSPERDAGTARPRASEPELGPPPAAPPTAPAPPASAITSAAPAVRRAPDPAAPAPRVPAPAATSAAESLGVPVPSSQSDGAGDPRAPATGAPALRAGDGTREVRMIERLVEPATGVRPAPAAPAQESDHEPGARRLERPQPPAAQRAFPTHVPSAEPPAEPGRVAAPVRVDVVAPRTEPRREPARPSLAGAATAPGAAPPAAGSAIEIGAIEVRLDQPAAPAPRPAFTPPAPVGFDGYLSVRSYSR